MHALIVSRTTMLKIVTHIDGHKPRLSSQFAWSIGVEALSNYFSDVPQYEDLRVWFSDRPLKYRSTMQKIATEKLPYQIFTMWYSITRRDPSWYFMVYPVESRKKSLARELLESEGFPWIRSWLKTEHNDTEMITPHHLMCVFHPASNSLRLEHKKG
jgi:hypothetical protein